MTGQQLINKIRRYTRTNSGTFDDDTILEIINGEYGIIMAKIIQTTGDYNISGKCVSADFVNTDGLTQSNTGYDGHYSFPVDLIRPARVEVSYDGINYVRATEYDLNDNEQSEVSWEGEFSESDPYVRFYNDNFVVKPTPKEDVVKGFRLYYEHRSIGEVGDGTSYDITLTTSPALEEVFQPLIVWLVCMNYGLIYPEKDNPQWGKKAYGTEQDMLRFYSSKFGRTRTINPMIDDYS